MTEIYDNIHGNIEIPDYIKEIIDTKEFQRLRKIKQLGLVYNVFVSASHNRFEHSLGVYYLAKKYIEILEKNKSKSGTELFSAHEKKIIHIAALVHDIGHGPFSHLFDDLTKSKHEIRSVKIFEHMNIKYKFGYSEDDIILIHNIIDPSYIDFQTKKKKYIYQIVSNPNGIDVDRMDYMLRDIKMTGLNYGIEIEQIMKNSIIYCDDSECKIIFRDKIYLQIQHLFQVRYIIYKNVCNHTTVRSIEAMIKDILIYIDPLFNISKCIKDNDWEHFNMLTDSIIDTAYIHCKFFDAVPGFNSDNPIHSNIISLIDRINNRNLYKFKGEIVSKDEITESIKNEYLHHDIEVSGNHNENLLFDLSKIKYFSGEKPQFETKILNLSNIYSEYSRIDNKVNITEHILKVFNKN